METRVYIVRHKKTGKARMVDAPTSAAALRHVMADEYKVEVAKAREASLLTSEGVAIEDAGVKAQGSLL